MEKILTKPEATRKNGKTTGEKQSASVDSMDILDIGIPEAHLGDGDLEDYTEIYGEMDDLIERSI